MGNACATNFSVTVTLNRAAMLAIKLTRYGAVPF